jgi:phage-related protein
MDTSMQVVIFQEDDGSVPFLEWLDELPDKVRTKVIVRVERLAECGHELRRPESDFLRDGIHELRIGYAHANYRLLYFFDEGEAVVSHGITKEKEVPKREIERAIKRRQQYAADPLRHGYEME